MVGYVIGAYQLESFIELSILDVSELSELSIMSSLKILGSLLRTALLYIMEEVLD